MNLVNSRDQHRWGQDHQEDVTQDEIRTPHREFDNLDDKLTSRLHESRGTELDTMPFTRPPCPIRLVVLVLSGQEYSDQDLGDGALNGNDGDQSEYCLRGVPVLEVPLCEHNE